MCLCVLVCDLCVFCLRVTVRWCTVSACVCYFVCVFVISCVMLYDLSLFHVAVCCVCCLFNENVIVWLVCDASCDGICAVLWFLCVLVCACVVETGFVCMCVICCVVLYGLVVCCLVCLFVCGCVGLLLLVLVKCVCVSC